MSSDELEQLHTLIFKCGSISSTDERAAVFKKFGEPIKTLISIIYDPFRKFNTTSKSILKREKDRDKDVKAPTTLEVLLEQLSDGVLTGHLAMDTCLTFMHSQDSKYRDTILKAINKDLKIRVGVQIVNKVFPMLVPVFSCALSHPIENHQKFFDDNKGQWWISRKLDGCRCMFVCRQGTVKAYSRSGHIYPDHIPGLSYFLQRMCTEEKDFVIDGEMTVMDDSGKEFFNIANSIMNPNAAEDQKKKSKHGLKLKENQFLCYYAFDYIPLEVFKSGHGGPKWSVRQKMLKAFLPTDKQVRVLEQSPDSEMERMWDTVVENGYEGIMFRLDANYEGKKSRKMLKKKMQQDEEFIVEDASVSDQMPPDSTVLTKALEHMMITYKGKQVRVVSGLTWQEKVEYGKNPQQLIGKQVTVKHYGATQDNTGAYSLRHPTVKAIYLNGRLT